LLGQTKQLRYYNVIIKIESGATPNPTIETMAKTAKGLGVSIDDLMK